MLMKVQPEHEAELDARGSMPARISPQPDSPRGPGYSAGAVIGRLVIGVLGLGIGAFLGLLAALLSGLVDIC